MDIAQLPVLAAAATTAASTAAPWWGPLGLQLIGTLGGSLGGVWIGARLVGRREHAAREQKRVADALYLAVTVSGVLERFASDCGDVAGDDGTCRGQTGPDGELSVQVNAPALDYAGLDVVWMALPGALLDQVHSIPRKHENVEGYLGFLGQSDNEESYFADRQRKYAELGLAASGASRALRSYAGLSPEIDSTSTTVSWLETVLEKRIRIDKEHEEQQVEMWNSLAERRPDA